MIIYTIVKARHIHIVKKYGKVALGEVVAVERTDYDGHTDATYLIRYEDGKQGPFEAKLRSLCTPWLRTHQQIYIMFLSEDHGYVVRATRKKIKEYLYSEDNNNEE